MIEQFQGCYRWLSNMVILDAPIVDDFGIKYYSTENYYQAAKSLDINIRQQIASLEPRKSKTYGRTIEIRPDWDSVKDGVMYTANVLKYKQPRFKQLLIDTGTEKIQEGNMWGDTYWGVCLKTNKGKNKLGKLLMSIRSEIAFATTVVDDTDKNKLTDDDLRMMRDVFDCVENYE